MSFMKSTYDKIWESALRSIRARMMSRSELGKRLEKKYPEEGGSISQILDEMERVELLNDKRYAEQLISHLTQRPIGRLKIMVETRKRGLNPDVVEGLLLSIGYDEEESCKKALEEKVRAIRESDPRKRKQKLMNFLRNRGFKDSVIYSVLKNS
jgi:regulatory protein